MIRHITALSTLLAVGGLVTGCVVHQRAPNDPPPPAVAPAPAPTAAPAPAPTAAPAPAPAPTDEIAVDPEDPPPVATPLPPQETVEAPPPTPGLAERLPDGVGDGRPKGIEPGAPVAYWIWRNKAGIWKLRTTTAKKLHQFRGRVKGLKHAIKKVRPSRQEFGDRMAKGTGGEVFFRFHTKGHVDGFDFKVPGCVRFDLQLDKGPAQKRVFIGKTSMKPKNNHFVLCPGK